jgi:hypothetical protein
MTDGLGRRVAASDPATGEPVEHLELAPELVLHTAFATVLGERVARLAAVRHASYVHVLRVDRPSIDTLVIVSDATRGHRLSDLLDAAEAAGVRPEIDSVVALVRQLLPAVALFSRHNRDNAIGTIGPERLFIVPPARVVIADAAFGPALDQLGLSRSQAWQRYRVAAPPVDGTVACTPRCDAMALGVVALSMLLGRRLTADEFPDQLPALVAAARERHGDDDHPLSSVFARWLRRALQLDGNGFDSPHAAQIAFEEVLASNRRYVTGTGALEQWVEQHGGALPGSSKHEGSKHEGSKHEGSKHEGSKHEGSRHEGSDLVGSKPEGGEPEAAAPGAADVAPAGRRVLGLRPQWAAVILGVLLMQAAVIGWYWSRPAAGPVEGEGELVVTSRPDGARVVVDGDDRGATPLTVSLSAGAHVIEVRAGTGEPRVIPLMIRANMQTAQYVELQQPTPPPPAVERRVPAAKTSPRR